MLSKCIICGRPHMPKVCSPELQDAMESTTRESKMFTRGNSARL